jgi:hypothetical protein
MDFRFGDIHLDPADDPPELHQAVFNLFCELWGRLREVREPCGDDRLLLALIDHVQRELIVVAMVLKSWDSSTLR